MNSKQLEFFRDTAVVQFNKKAIGLKLPGASRPMTMEDARALSFYESAVMLLNKAGAIKEGWLDANPIEVLEESSDPMSEDYL